MISIVRRIVLLLKIWWIRLFESAQDSREVFAAAHRRQQALLDRVRDARRSVVESRKHLEDRVATMKGGLSRLERRAREALGDGREDTARLVLFRRQAGVEQIKQLEEQIAQLDREEHALSLVGGRLSNQIETYFARYDDAEARAKISEALSDVSPEFADPGKALERAEERAEQMQARAEAIDELTELGVLQLPAPSGDPLLPDDLTSVSVDSTEAVERMLSDMKQQARVEG